MLKQEFFCSEHTILEYTGPKTANELWKDEKFRIASLVRVGTAKIVRTRPIFPEWTCVITLSYNPEICNESQITNWLETAGSQCGAFDWRPKYGRFIVEKLK